MALWTLLSVLVATWAAALTGAVPASIGIVERAVWLPGTDASALAWCAAETAGEWRCPDLPPDATGVVAVVGDRGLAYTIVRHGAAGRSSIAIWGRLVRVLPGGVASEELGGVRLTPWRVARSAARPRASRLTITEESNVEVQAVSDTAAWVSGRVRPGPDAFLQLQGPAVATIRVAIPPLADGPVDVPFEIPAQTPELMQGRVEGERNHLIADAEITLLAPVPGQRTDKQTLLDDTQDWIEIARTRSTGEGTFAFAGLPGDSYTVMAATAADGRGSTRVDRLRDPVVVKLNPPRRAVGRVLRQGIPVAGARVRFVPDLIAFQTGRDPTDYVAVEARTEADGRFVIALPPRSDGTIQVIPPGGAMTRVPLAASSGDVTLGDIVVSVGRVITIRVLDTMACALTLVGPLGQLGLTTITSQPAAPVHLVEIPERGVWALSAECDGALYAVEPPVLDVDSTPVDVAFDIAIVRRQP